MFLAMVIPVGGDVGGGHPAHPIAPGGGGGYPSHPIFIPPGINYPTFPTNPIAPGGQPPGYWGGVAPPLVDNTLPGQPPIVWKPIFPANPIAPGGNPNPPVIWYPTFPSQLPMPGGGGGEVDNTLPGDQPGVSNPISGGFILIYHPVYGYSWVSGSGSGSSGGEGDGEYVDNELPMTPSPKK